MATIEQTWEFSAAELDTELASLRQSRHDLLIETPDGPDAWTMTEGPFERYHRTLSIDALAGGASRVSERIDYKMAVPFWWPYLSLLMKRGLRDRNRTPRRRWWWPREVVATETAQLIGHLGAIGAMAGYMGVVIGQTITFAAEEFGSSDADQANTLAAVRVGVLLSMVFIARADHQGRRPLLLRFTLAAILLTATGALAPNLWALGTSQALARGLTTGLLTLVALASTEEVPAGSRAMAIAFMYMTAGFGAALVVWVIPLADFVDGGWRIIYALCLLFLPVLWRVAKAMPETRRFRAAATHQAPGDINWKRFALIASTVFIGALFLSPASQMRNEFLRDDLGFTATGISGFQLLISWPATMAVPLGGHLADRYNRRWVGAGGLAVASVMSAISYQSSGWVLWVAATIGFSSASAAVPALRGYQTELFPTRARARVGGMIDVIAVAGSAVGLVVVGQLAVRWNSLGDAISVMVWAPLVVAVIILAFFPETARVELEDLNPTDPALEPQIPDGGSRPV